MRYVVECDCRMLVVVDDVVMMGFDVFDGCRCS